MHGSLKQQQLFWQLVPRLANTSQQSYEQTQQFFDKMRLEHKNKSHLVILKSIQRHQIYAKQKFVLKIFRAENVFAEVNEEPPSPRR
jgi:hypothetical protein